MSNYSEIRMLALDLDRTLLRDDKSLSPLTLDALRACRRRGLLLAVATARPPRSVRALSAEVEWDAAVCANGALVRAGGDTLARYGVPARDARRILTNLADAYPGARLSCELNDALYANFDVSAVWNGASAIRSDFTDLPDLPCEKILVDAQTRVDAQAIERLLTPELYCLTDFEGLSQILNRNASKMRGIRALCERFHLSPANVASFGDDCADLQMLRECGVGIAVENAVSEAKAAARCVCASNEEDGPARWIAANLL